MKWARRSRSAVDEVPEAGHRWEAPASAVDGVRIGLTLDDIRLAVEQHSAPSRFIKACDNANER